jgi:site-specific DNA-methyltransferase (adenine-specific)
MIHCGDLFDLLQALDANSVDAGVTDPPYGIGFMGREWDTFKPGTGKTRRLMHPRERVAAAQIVSDNPNIHGRHRSPALSPSQIDYDYSTAGLRGFQSWTEQWAREVLRVLKPGAYLVVCGAPRSHHRMMCGIEDAGFVVRDCFAWLFGSGFPKNRNLGDGRGTALKPAHEPIALAWKPFKGSITANVEKWGTGALNIDACRVGEDDTRRVKEGGRGQFPHEDDAWTPKTVTVGSDSGRWPANVLLDEEAAAALDEMTGELQSGSYTGERSADKFRDLYNNFAGTKAERGREGSVGGASRFYYVAKPSREERDYGCRRNDHPTVKPIELMRWLVRLVTPPHGTVLDPFMGSGTTGMACRYELREFIGIEREAAYVRIAERRIAAVAPLFVERGAEA